MTTFEHAMLGIDGVLAVGLDRRWGWSLCAMAAVASAFPDWDGLTILGGASLFAAGHRIWGHALIVCLSVAAIFAMLDYRYDLMTRSARFFVRVTRLTIPNTQLTARTDFSPYGFAIWIVVAMAATVSHLIGDIVVSGTAELADWSIQPFWPFCKKGLVFPLVPWGDPGISIIFFVGMFAMLRWKHRIQTIAIVTLLAVAVYAAIRGSL